MTETTTLQREHLASVMDYLLAHKSKISYPVNDVRTQTIHGIATMTQLVDAIDSEEGLVIDCSQAVELVFHVAGLNSPYQDGYDVDGATGSELDGPCPHFTDATEALLGSIVVFGAPPGLHTAIVRHGAVPNPTLWSQGRPQDPSLRLLSDFADEFSQHVFLSILHLG
jgi:hypothetical protein